MSADPADALGGRLPLADPATLTGEQRALFDRMMARVVPWADEAGFQSTAADGRLIGPFNPALLNPAVTVSMLDLSVAERTHTSLSDRVREVVILAVGAVWRADYEVYAHMALARTAGLSEQAARMIAAGEEPAELSEDEAIVQRLTTALSVTHRVDDAFYRQAEKAFGAHGLVDIAFLIGIYHAVCATLTLFSIPAPGQAGHSLRDHVHAVAHQLCERGVGPGDVVAVKLRNRVEFVIVLFAAWRVGAVVTPINPSLTDGEVTRQLADSAARLLVLDEDAAAAAEVPTLAVADLATTPEGQAPPPHEDPSALALLIYTSGTTGTPKGVMLDHANLDAMAEMGRQALHIGADDRCLLILPLFHVNGIVVSVVTPLLAGASVVIADRSTRPRSSRSSNASSRLTSARYPPSTPCWPRCLADVTPDTSSVRFAICGAAPASAELLARFEQRYGFPLIEGYGLSEGTCASTINPPDDPRAGTVGTPFPGQRIRIVDAAGNDVALGSDGEVLIAGPNVMRGYLGRPADTARTVVDGWLHTGDIGQLDADGYLTLAGRSKDMIIRGGENIYPREIEDVLSGDPTVLEAAVIGCPDEKWGEVVIAYVAPRPGATIDSDALHALCARSLAGYKRPTSIVVLEDMPKNPLARPTRPCCAPPTPHRRHPHPIRKRHDEGVHADPLRQDRQRRRR